MDSIVRATKSSPHLTPDQFITKWKAADLKKRSARRNRICRLLKSPLQRMPTLPASWYAFERGATNTTGGEGWRTSGSASTSGGRRQAEGSQPLPSRNFSSHCARNPPLLVVCDLDRFRIHTNWTNSISEVHEFGLDDLRAANVPQKLEWMFSDPID